MSRDSIQIAGLQRRSDVRVPARLPVRLSARVVSLSDFKDTGHSETIISSCTTTISGGGFSMVYHQAIPLGTSFNVQLQMPGTQRPLTMKAKVVRCSRVKGDTDSPEFELGLAFSRIAEAACARIVSYVFKIQQTTTAEETHKESKEVRYDAGDP
ncbi:MAG TPA: PilZ domain-containing protein [Acidobacteriota bacterium]|nr:PilZ domain-containing protein [Acidobacteriota bacterium]